MSELKPCPFCGSREGVHLSRERDNTDMAWQYQVVCDYNFFGCGASGCFNADPKKAVEAWNRRAGEQE